MAADVCGAHHDLVGHEHGASRLLRSFDPSARLQPITRPELLSEMARLAARTDAILDYKTKVIKRFRRIRESERALWTEISNQLIGTVDLDRLVSR